MIEPTPAVSFVIPVRNDAQRLRRCLDTIRTNHRESCPVEVIVADNGSTDDSAAVAAGSGAVVLDLPGHRVGELRNLAAARARAPILAFVDADHEIGPDWVASAVETLQDSSVAAVGALCDPPRDGTWVQKTYGALRGRVAGRRDVEWLGSGNLAIRKSAFDAHGGFDITLETCEDVELCGRLRRSGLRIVSDDRLESVHLGDPATLAALFRGELWRGRDNLRASLREPLTLRALPSVMIPVAELALVAAVGVGVFLAPFIGPRLFFTAMTLLALLVAARAVRMVMGMRAPGPLQVAQAIAVAAVYDLARAFALVSRVTHRTRVAT
jgi:glycosyltransferase involved in cell wall biosynthesis